MENKYKYILDNNAFIKIDRLIKKGDLSIENCQKFVSLFELVSQNVPYKLFEEYRKNCDASFMSNQNRTLNLEILPEEIFSSYKFFGKKDRNCKGVKISKKNSEDKWELMREVENVDVEIIVKCIKDELIYVSDDISASYLADRLGVEVLTTESFLNNNNINIEL